MRGVVIEVGPAAIRRIDGGPELPAGLAEAVLRGIDDPVVLHDDRPTDVGALLRDALATAAGTGPASLTVLHPSWWPQSRVARVLAAGPGPVVALTRAAWIRRQAGAGTVIEFGDTVAVSTADTLCVRTHPDPGWVTRAIGDATEVLLDDPHRTAAAACIRTALRSKGIEVRDVDLTPPASRRSCPAPRPRHIALSAAVLLGSVALAGLGAGPDGGAPGAEGRRGAAVESVSVVEGRVAVRIPADWTVRRVTGGPGSARLEISSPSDPAAVVHLTSSYTPDTTLTATADALHRAAAALPRDVYSGITPATTAGRPVLTYRESRPGRTVHWAVLLDGDTRIAIGCQGAAGRDDTARSACEQAVSSAREVIGTDYRPAASN